VWKTDVIMFDNFKIWNLQNIPGLPPP
jgi:hypothetical protein